MIVLQDGGIIKLDGDGWKLQGGPRGTNFGSKEEVLSRLEADRVGGLFDRLQTLQSQSETYEKETAFWMDEAMEESETREGNKGDME